MVAEEAREQGRKKRGRKGVQRSIETTFNNDGYVHLTDY